MTTSRRDRRRPGSTLQTLTSQTRRKKNLGFGTELLELLRRSPRLPLWAKHAMVTALPLAGNRLVDTAMLSNLGSIPDPPSFGPDAGRTTEAWFSPPARMPLGLTIGALTLDRRLHLALRYHHQLFNAAAASRFADTFVAHLVRLVRPHTAEMDSLLTQAAKTGWPVNPLGLDVVVLGDELAGDEGRSLRVPDHAILVHGASTG